LKRTNVFLFFVLPFGGLAVIFFLFSSLNRDYVQRKVEALAEEQLQATSEILRTHVARLLDDGVDPEKIIAISAGEESIYYLALLDDSRSILSWSSRFEGYLPLSSEDIDRTRPWIIASPVGRIFNSISPVPTAAGRTYFLYLGYALSGLDGLIVRSDRNFRLVFAALIAVGVVFFLGVFALQRSYLAKTREAEAEKLEKERFREISGLTSAVAHEIKNPLNSLSLLFELLQKNAPDGLREETALAKAEVRKIADIVDRFSNLLRPPQPRKSRVVLRDLIAAVQESFRPTSASSARVFSTSCATPWRRPKPAPSPSTPPGTAGGSTSGSATRGEGSPRTPWRASSIRSSRPRIPGWASAFTWPGRSSRRTTAGWTSKASPAGGRR
jgi:signal transduction histidine kinase